MVTAICAAAVLGQVSPFEEVVFRVKYTDAAAKRVQVAGDYTGWSAPAKMTKFGDEWVFSASVPSSARLEYKLVIDGKWVTDPGNPIQVDNGIGGMNSVFIGPDYKLVTMEQTPKRPMVRREVTIDGRTVVYFAPKRSQGLPLLVYGDGENYETRGKVQNVLQNLVEAGKAKPAVIVLIQPLDRMKEYGAGWKDYGSFVLDKVLPAVRKATGASSSASKVFLGGSSMGGVISLRLAEEFPSKVAGGVHSQSGAFQWGPMILDYTSLTTPSAMGKLSPKLKLWIDWGLYEHELTQANVDAAATLKRMNRKFGSATSPEGHTWTSWRGRMVAGLTYLLGR